MSCPEKVAISVTLGQVASATLSRYRSQMEKGTAGKAMIMSSRRFAFGLLLALSASWPAAAEDTVQHGTTPLGVVELFTSQGCRSCPPADKALGDLVQQGGVVALSYHVDYWNYLGWQDTLATPDNTARQYAYARSLGRSGVYTPQAVINGLDHVPGSDMQAITSKIKGLHEVGRGMEVPVSARQRGDEINIDIGSGDGTADVVMVYFKHQQNVDVLKGENKGKTFTYWNSVTDIQTVGMWHGKDMSLVLPAKVMKSGKSDGCAVLLQRSNDKGEPSAIVGATVLMSKPE